MYPKKPYFIRIDVTSRCNFNCPGCYRSKTQPKDLSTEKIFQVIDVIKDFGVKSILFSGGEPFCRKDLKDIIKYADKQGIKCNIVTNGFQFDDFKFLKKYIKILSISLDGHTEETNSRIRPKNTFNKIIDNLHKLKENKIKFNLITTLSKQNIEYLEEIIKFGQDIGAIDHTFVRFLPLGQGAKFKDWYIEDLEWQIILKRLQQDDRLLFDEKYFTHDCGSGREYLYILGNGDISICTKGNHPIGNIFENDIKFLWNNSPLLKTLRNTKHHDCLHCNYGN